MTKSRVLRALRWVAAYLVAAAGLVWVLHDVDWAKLAGHVSGLDWRWVALAIVLDVVSYVGQGLRWSLLLRPVGAVSLARATQAVYAGLFANEIVPFHLGELFRAYPVSRWLKAPIVAVVPSMALERLFDGIWLAAGFGLTALFVPLPRRLAAAGDIFGAVILALTALLVFLVVRKVGERTGDPPEEGRRPGPRRWIARNLALIDTGIRSIGLTRFSGAALAVSLAMVLLQALSFWLILVAYGLRVSLWIGSAVFLIVRFGTVLPGAPGNLGLYQVFSVLGLTLFGIDKTPAAGFSIVVWVLLSIPLWVLGFIALGRTGLTLASIKAGISEKEVWS